MGLGDAYEVEKTLGYEAPKLPALKSDNAIVAELRQAQDEFKQAELAFDNAKRAYAAAAEKLREAEKSTRAKLGFQFTT